MLSKKIINFDCIEFKPNNSIKQIKMLFDYDINKQIIRVNDKMTLQIISDNMKTNYHCEYFLKFMVPVSDSKEIHNMFYYLFFESDNDSQINEYLLNKNGTYIINYLFDKCQGLIGGQLSFTNLTLSNEGNLEVTKFECYGNCYLLLVDANYDVQNMNMKMINKIDGLIRPSRKCNII
jgi:hypothetical protein